MFSFWTDVLFTMTYFCALTSTAIAIMILLPRSMAEEAGAAQTAQVYVNRPPQHSNFQSYRKASPLHPDHVTTATSATSASADADSMHPVNGRNEQPGSFINFSDSHHSNGLVSPWEALGERLNVDKNALGEFRDSRGAGRVGEEEGAEMYQVSAPFAAGPGARRLAEGEEVHHIPRHVSVAPGICRNKINGVSADDS